MADNLGVTVVVVCYNHERFVEELLDSILVQTRAPERVLIIDDASGDSSVARIVSWLSRHPEAGYELVVHPQNIGLCRGLNEALETITTPFYTYVSADDRMIPERLESLIDRWVGDGHRAVAVYSNARRIDEEGQVLQPDYRTLHEWPSGPGALEGNIHTRLLHQCWLPAASVLVATEAVRTVGGYDERWFFEDYDLWLRLAAHGRIICVDEPLVDFREVSTSLGTTRFRDDDAGFLAARVGILLKQVGVSDEGDAYIRTAMPPLAIRLWRTGEYRDLVVEALRAATQERPALGLGVRLALARVGVTREPGAVRALARLVRETRDRCRRLVQTPLSAVISRGHAPAMQRRVAAAHGVRRVAVLAIGDPRDPGLWSGTPSNLVQGLEEAGVDVITVDCSPVGWRFVRRAVQLAWGVPGLAKRGRRTAMRRALAGSTQSMTHLRLVSWTAARRLRTVGPVDGVLQMGTGYSVRHPRTASYEDMTIPQALQWPSRFWGTVPQRTTVARSRHQVESYAANHAALFSTGWAADSAVNDCHCPSEKARAVGISANFEVEPSHHKQWSPPRFLFPAREWIGKGGPQVAKAFSDVRREFPEAELHLVGQHPQVEFPGVICHGWKDLRDPGDRADMEDLWRRATCCIALADCEPAGIIFVEAMQAGVPSIGPAVGGPGWLLGDTGITVDRDDHAALVAAMKTAADPESARERSGAARHRASEFTRAAVARRIMAAIDE